MAVKVANEILSNPDSTGIRTLCKVLPMLEISVENEMLVRDLSVLCPKILEVCMLCRSTESCFFLQYDGVLYYRMLLTCLLETSVLCQHSTVE